MIGAYVQIIHNIPVDSKQYILPLVPYYKDFYIIQTEDTTTAVRMCKSTTPCSHI